MTAPSAKYRLNAKPRLSANQLADYLNASSIRRKRVIQDAKFPRTPIVARYKAARDGITDYLCDQARPTSTLVSAIDQMKTHAAASESPWTKQDSLLSIEAIESFHSGYGNNQMGVRKIECRDVTGSQPLLPIEGVQVSVALDATTHRKDKDGKDRVGGIILLFSKSETSSNDRVDRCKTAAVLALMFAEKHLKPLGKADPKLCFALDIFGKKAHPAPSSYKQRLNNINAACDEIADRWDSIEPPEDYDGPSWKKEE
jgi:hypothetical protein